MSLTMDPPARLRAALEHDGFFLVRQRILPLHGGLEAAPCYEVFLRLREEEDQHLPPGGFFPVAEQYGLMAEIDRWVARKLMSGPRPTQHGDATAWPVYWHNLSRAALCSAEFVRSLARQLDAESFPGRRLCYELNERDVAARPREAQRLVDALRPLGCRFALDGFGQDEGALQQVGDFQADFLKIDGPIVLRLLRDAGAPARVRAIQALAKAMGARTVAQWVEDAPTLTAVRRLGVDYAQGYGIARPEPLPCEAAGLCKAL
jgi:EAL domain-containing protein (putative c-di-GMP-specific phosphodiesterase class I)